MSEQTVDPRRTFSVLTETARGSGTYTIREPYNGTDEEAREYAQNIAQAEGVGVKLTTADGELSEEFEPKPVDGGQS